MNHVVRLTAGSIVRSVLSVVFIHKVTFSSWPHHQVHEMFSFLQNDRIVERITWCKGVSLFVRKGMNAMKLNAAHSFPIVSIMTLALSAQFHVTSESNSKNTASGAGGGWMSVMPARCIMRASKRLV